MDYGKYHFQKFLKKVNVYILTINFKVSVYLQITM